MQCRECGTEIADKAIVCFRCGTPTLDPGPGRNASSSRPGASWPAWVAPLVVLAGAIAGALYGVEGSWARAGIVAGGLVLAGAAWWRLRRPQGGGQKAG